VSVKLGAEVLEDDDWPNLYKQGLLEVERGTPWVYDNVAKKQPQVREISRRFSFLNDFDQKLI